jgi:hypothetical protein
MLVQVGHRRVDALLMGGQHGLFADVVGQGTQQRHALGSGERQIETMHRARGVYPSARRVGGDPVIEPAGRHLSVSKPAMQRACIQPGQLTHRCGVPGHDPGRYPGVAFGVVLA